MTEIEKIRQEMLGNVKCYVGGRGSGKTASLAVDDLLAMMAGLPIWSNLPVKANIEWAPGKISHYETLPLNIDALRVFDRDITHGVISIDEMNLWADSLNWQQKGTQLIAAVFQLITRKRQVGFITTVQNFKWLNNRIRWQTDEIITCFDLAFRYHNLEKGTKFSQLCVDMSGHKCGHAFEEGGDNSKNVKSRVFHFRPFWGIYDTNLEFDIFEATQKVKIEQRVKTINVDDIRNEQANVFTRGYDVANDPILENVFADLKRDKRYDWIKIRQMARESGFRGSDYILRRQLESLGIVPAGKGKVMVPA